jgi:predicted phage terminase large subunit-like protein
VSTTLCASASSAAPPDDPFLAGLLRATNRKLGLPDHAGSRWPSPGALARDLWPAYVTTAALEAIDQALVDVAEGRCDRLIISMPPQEGKSEKVSHYFPLWLLTRNPALRIAIVSYQQRIAERWGRAIRNDVTTFGGRDGNIDLKLRIAPDNGSVGDWAIAGQPGGVYCVGIGGALTSRPVDVLLIDDPFKDRKAAMSELLRENAWTWWTGVGIPRLAPGAPVVLVMTRWHEDDLAGRFIAEDDSEWRVLNIPAEADHDPEKGQTDPLGRAPGEFMDSARRRTRAMWERIKRRVGSSVWTALYQGRPAPDDGAVWLRSWWKFYRQPLWTEADGVCTALHMDEVLQSWDMTFKDTKGADYVVGTVWGRRGSQAYLLDRVRARMDFTATATAVQRLAKRWPQAHAKLVEDKANGPAVIAYLKKLIGGLIAVTPYDSKQARASAVAPFIEAGDVWLPDPALCPWVVEFIDEAAAFPNGKHDDQVDSASQALARLLLKSGQGEAFLDAWRQMAAEKATEKASQDDLT